MDRSTSTSYSQSTIILTTVGNSLNKVFVFKIFKGFKLTEVEDFERRTVEVESRLEVYLSLFSLKFESNRKTGM